MFQQGRRPSDSESLTSEASEITSRATTLTEPWSTTPLQQQQQQQQRVFNSLHIQSTEVTQSQTSLNTTISANTVISNRTTGQIPINDPSNQFNTQIKQPQQQQQQQQAWVNQYWDSDPKPNLPTSQIPQNNTNIEHSSIDTSVQQLIPGSILINDQGEIDDLSYKQNINHDSNISNNSFNPGGKYVSDDSGGPGGYLVPTHIQRRIVTSSSSGVNVHSENQVDQQGSSSLSNVNTYNPPELNRQQNVPQNTDPNVQSWVNPYWPKSNQTNNQSTSNDNNNLQQNSQIKSSEKPSSSTNTWENPYWKDKCPSYRKTNDVSLNKSLSYESQKTPVPSFYERIYPPASPIQTVHPNHATVLLAEISQSTTNNNDDLPYTIDQQGVAHYRQRSSPINSTNKTVNFVTQNPVLSENISSAISISQNNTSSVVKIPTSNTYRLSSLDYSSLIHASSSNILTEEDLNGIQNALHLLTTNSNAIPIIEAPNQFTSYNTNYYTDTSSPLTSFFSSNQSAPSFQPSFTGSTASNQPIVSLHSAFVALAAHNEQQQSNKQPSSSLFSQNVQYNSNTKQTTVFSTPSYPSNLNEIARQFIAPGPVVLI